MGPGIWKMNNAHLKEHKCTEGITDLWYKHQQTKFDYASLGEWWDEGKLKKKNLVLVSLNKKQNNRRTINII